MLLFIISCFLFLCVSKLATWDSNRGLNGSLKENRVESSMHGVTLKVVTLLVCQLIALHTSQSYDMASISPSIWNSQNNVFQPNYFSVIHVSITYCLYTVYRVYCFGHPLYVTLACLRFFPGVLSQRPPTPPFFLFKVPLFWGEGCLSQS